MGRTRLKETQFHETVREKIESGGSGGGGNRNQVTKLGVTASPDSPRIIDIEIPPTTDFNRGTPVEVLKFVPGEQNVVTLCEFDNADASDFEPDPMVEFDGTMHLKTQHEILMKDEGILGEGRLWSATLDLSQFRVIEKIEVK